MNTNVTNALPPANEVIAAMASHLASQDPAVSEALLADPQSAYEKAAGKPPPAGLNIRAVRNTADEVNLPIPAYETLDEAVARALQDSEVQKISGGFEIIVVVFAGIGTAIGAGAGAASVLAGATVVAGGAAAGAAVVGGAVGGGVAATSKKKK